MPGGSYCNLIGALFINKIYVDILVLSSYDDLQLSTINIDLCLLKYNFKQVLRIFVTLCRFPDKHSLEQ